MRTRHELDLERVRLAQQGWIIPDYLICQIMIDALVDTLLIGQAREIYEVQFIHKYESLIANAITKLDSNNELEAN